MSFFVCAFLQLHLCDMVTWSDHDVGMMAMGLCTVGLTSLASFLKLCLRPVYSGLRRSMNSSLRNTFFCIFKSETLKHAGVLRFFSDQKQGFIFGISKIIHHPAKTMKAAKGFWCRPSVLFRPHLRYCTLLCSEVTVHCVQNRPKLLRVSHPTGHSLREFISHALWISSGGLLLYRVVLSRTSG